MIISHTYRFIFVKTIKTAGTSIEAYLSPHCGDQDVFTPLNPPVSGHQPRNFGRFYNHFSAWGIRQAVPADIWNTYFKWCVERNPWDKTVSDYCMLRHRSGGRVSFEDYLARGRFPRSWELYTDMDNQTILVDQVLRYENLDTELGAVFDRLGVPWEGRLGVRAKSGYRTDPRPYQEWFDESQRDRVARAFADELREFAYAF
ncbi:hypothetical protein [Elongatibacter sediminis]|uniref:Sulfotransferase family protein n=1 Tax=Elongatibacter sediminis TaxID=3119006 RepID=A0AAW9RPQ1_9GAMM